MNWKLILKSVAAAAIAGAANSSAQALTAGNTKAMGWTAAAGAVIGLCGYLAQSPVQK
jgi:hypothetical protein